MQWYFNKNTFWFKTIHLKMSLAKWRSFGIGVIMGVVHLQELEIHIVTLRPRQNGLHFPDDMFKKILRKIHIYLSIKITLMFVHKDPIDNIPALIQMPEYCAGLAQ